PLFVHIGGFWLRTNILSASITVGFTYGVTTGGERYGFFIIHCHTRKGDTNIVGGFLWVRIAVHPFRLNVNQPHHYRRQGAFHVALTYLPIAFTTPSGKLYFFRAPVDIVSLVPIIYATTSKAKGLQPHGLIDHSARENQQVSPGEFVAVFTFERPQEATGFV